MSPSAAGPLRVQLPAAGRCASRARSSSRRVSAAAAPKQSEQPGAGQTPAPAAKRDPAWSEVKGMEVEVANRGGVIVRLSASLTGFVPVSQLDPSRVPARGEGGSPESALASLVGAQLRCTVLELNADSGSLVLSEKAALAAAELAALQPGDVRSGRVKKVADYGAFVELDGADGRPHGLEGLVHISELSWSRVRHPADVVRPGQQLKVQVLSAEPGRVALSLRLLQADPLLETLDTILPAGLREGGEGGEAEEELPGLAALVEALRAAAGVEAVTLGRQAREQRVVSQDLELWMTNEKVTDGYSLVARYGRLVQELHLRSQLDRDAVKLLVLRVTAASRTET